MYAVRIPLPVNVSVLASPLPMTCTNAATCNISPALAPFTRTTDVPFVAV